MVKKTLPLDLLTKVVLFTVHNTNIQTFLLEMYKIKHNFFESCLKDLCSAVNGTANGNIIFVLNLISEFQV